MSSAKKPSHRFKIAVVAALAGAGTLAVTIGIATILVSRVKLSTALASLEDSMAPALAQLETGNETALRSIVEVRPGVSASLFDQEGVEVLGFGPNRPGPIEGRGLARIGDREVVFVGDRREGRLLVLSSDWTETGDTIAELAGVLAVLCIPLTLVIAALSWNAAGRMFDAIDRVTNEATRLSTTDRTARLSQVDDKEIGSLVDQLNDFLDRLESEIDRQEQFIADASHELRTPVTALRGQIETSLMRARTGDEYRKLLETAHAETLRLQQIVESLLQSKREPGRFETVPLDDLVNRRVAAWIDRYVEAGVTLDAETEPVSVRGDVSSLEVVVDNLLNNVLRHATGSSNCQVTLVGGDHATITVSDDGVGIEPDHRSKVFDRFWRKDSSRNRSSGGFGIGLALVDRVVKAHNGKVWMEANKPQGNRAVVRLPIAAQSDTPTLAATERN